MRKNFAFGLTTPRPGLGFLMLLAGMIQTFGAVVIGPGSQSTNSSSSTLEASVPRSGWSNRIPVDVTTANCGPTELQRLAFSLNSAHVNFSIVRPDGYDLRLYDTDGATAIPFYLASLATSNATLACIVTNLDGTGVRRLWLDYGKTNASDVSQRTNVLLQTPGITNGTAGRWLVTEGSGTNITNSAVGIQDAGNLYAVNSTWVATNSPGPQGTNTGFNGPYLRLNRGGYLYSTNGALANTKVPAITVRMWVRLNAVDNAVNWIYQKAPINNGEYMAIRFANLTTNFVAEGRNGAYALSGIAAVTNHWYHLVACWTYRSVRLWVDGHLTAEDGDDSDQTTLPTIGGYSVQNPVVINGDGRTGTVVTNTIGMDVGPILVDYRTWENEDVLSDFNFLGRPVPIRERQKVVLHGAITNSSPQLGQVDGEQTRFLSSYDGKWKVLYNLSGGAIHLGESDNANYGYVHYGTVLGGGTGGMPLMPHGHAVDDGAGSVYYFAINDDFNLAYARSPDGGRTWTGQATNTMSTMWQTYLTTPGSQGNVSITKLTEGPLAGYYGMLVELHRTNSFSFGIWPAYSTNITGPYVLLNNSNALDTLGDLRHTSSEMSRAFWANGRYHIYFLRGYATSPNCVARASTVDWSNWRIEDYFAQDMQDQNYALDQCGAKDFVSDQGVVSRWHVAIDNEYGDATMTPRLGPGRGVWWSFDGTPEQLITVGSVTVMPKLR